MIDFLLYALFVYAIWPLDVPHFFAALVLLLLMITERR